MLPRLVVAPGCCHVYALCTWLLFGGSRKQHVYSLCSRYLSARERLDCVPFVPVRDVRIAARAHCARELHAVPCWHVQPRGRVSLCDCLHSVRRWLLERGRFLRVLCVSRRNGERRVNRPL